MRWFITLISILISFQARSDWTLTTAIKKPNHALLLKQGKDVATYTPNSSLHLSLRLTGPFFFFQYSFKLPNTNYGQSDIGNNNYKDSRLGIYISNTLIEGFYKKYEGFSSTENGGNPGCENCLRRENLTSEENLFQFIFPFNREFSLRSAISGANAPVGMDGTWSFHAFYNRLKVRDSTGLVQGEFASNHTFFDNLAELYMVQYGVGPGLGFTLDLGEYFYLAGITSLGFGFQEIDLVYNDRVRRLQEFGLNYNLRFTFGTHNPKYNVGVRSLIVSNFFDIGEQISFSSVNYELRIYASFTF